MLRRYKGERFAAKWDGEMNSPLRGKSELQRSGVATRLWQRRRVRAVSRLLVRVL